jgi:alpha-galactosidase
MSGNLRDLLLDLAPGHRLAESLAVGPGASAQVDHDVRVAAAAPGDAVEVQLTVQGPGQAGAHLLDVVVNERDAILWTMRGGRFEAMYPPEAFAPVGRTLHPRLQFPWPHRLSTIEFGALDGRSSDGDMPFFLVTDLEGKNGLWFALGWSGQWRGFFRKTHRADQHEIWIEGPGSDLELDEGESLELPRVVVGAFEGDGWAAIRRHLSATAPRHYEPWVVYNSWFNEEGRITEDRLLEHVAVAADLGFDAFCVDAAWYETPGAEQGYFQTRGLGTWTVDERKFPGGLARFSKEVQAAGMTFGLWFEPERAHPESTVWTEHPEWIRTAPDQEFGLVDFGVTAAADWALEVMSAGVRDWSLGWIKWDMNFHDFRPYFEGDQRGELAHARGVWRVMAELIERHPDLILEACASGGNRIDIEMLNRCHSYWISDQTVSPDIVRATMSGAHRLLPAQYCYLSLSPQLEGQGVDDYPDEWFVGNMNGVLGIMERLSLWSPQLRQRAAGHIATFKEIRHLLGGDYIRFADSGDVPLGEWEAWEFSDPETGEAALVALRLNSPDEERTFEGRHSWTVSLPLGGATVEHRR